MHSRDPRRPPDILNKVSELEKRVRDLELTKNSFTVDGVPIRGRLEIAGGGGGGGGGGGAGFTPSYCVIGFNAHTYSLPGSPVASYGQAFPFDMVVANTGDYTVNPTFDVGAGIAPNQDGFYRCGLTGHAEWTFDLTTGAGSLSANETEVNNHWFEISCFPTVGHGSYDVRQPMPWGRIMDPAGTTPHRLVHDGSFEVQVISGPIELAAGNYVESFFTPTDSNSVSALRLDGELSSQNPVRFWLERVG